MYLPTMSLAIAANLSFLPINQSLHFKFPTASSGFRDSSLLRASKRRSSGGAACHCHMLASERLLVASTARERPTGTGCRQVLVGVRLVEQDRQPIEVGIGSRETYESLKAKNRLQPNPHPNSDCHLNSHPSLRTPRCRSSYSSSHPVVPSTVRTRTTAWKPLKRGKG